MTGIKKAIDAAGGQVKLAEALNVSQQVVSQWHTKGWVPAGRVIEIESLYGVPRQELVKPKLRDLLEPSAAAFEDTTK